MAVTKCFRVFTGTTPFTGQASNLDFRISPYGSGEIIAGLTFTETPASSANYKCTGINAYYQDVKCFLSGVEQTAMGIFDIGDPSLNFVELTGTQTVAGAKTFSTAPKSSVAASATTELVRYDEAVRTTGVQSIDGLKTFLTIPKNTGGRTYSGSNREIVDVGYLIENYGTGSGTNFGINTNRIFVDSKLSTDITGKAYNTIGEAISYASTQTPSSTSRWTIIIMSHQGLGYAEDITIPQWIDLVGWGEVYITGGLTTTHVTTSQTWGARDSKIQGLIFNTTDKAIYCRLLHVKDCILKCNGAGGEVPFYIDGSELWNTGIFTNNDVDLQANATEQENRVMLCYGNEEPVWESTDDVGSFTLLGAIYEF